MLLFYHIKQQAKPITMKLVTTRGEAGRYIVSAVHNGVIRFFEVCKDYNLDSQEYGGKYWYIYETTDDKYEWTGWGYRTKAQAVSDIKNLF